MEGRVRSARRADTRPFSQILSDGTQDNDRTFSVASPRTSRKGRKGGGSGRARAYAEIPKEPEYDNLPKPKQAINQQQRERMARKCQLRDCSPASRGPAQQRAAIAYTVNAVDIPQQYPSDSGEETPTCWFFMVRLCRCCAKRLFKRGSTRKAEEERLRELRLLEEEKKVMELQRRFEETRRRTDRRLEKAATKYEMRRKREEEKEKKEQQLLQEEVQDKCDNKAAGHHLSWGLTKQEMKKELKRLQKLQKSLSLQMHRLQQRQGMSAPWTTSSTDDDDDDDEEVVAIMETQHLRTNKQQQMTSSEIKRMAAMAKKTEKEQQDKWSRPVEDDDNSVDWEMEDRQHRLELQRQEMKHSRFAVAKTVQLNRHKEQMRELDSQWKLQYDEKKKGIDQHLERQREMAKRAEEELLWLIEEQQQKSNMKTNKYTETTAGQQKLCSQNIPREAEPWKVECPDVEPEEPQTQTNGESTMKLQLENRVHRAENRHPMEMQIWLTMQEQLKAMKHKFMTEGKMDAKRFEKRWKRMEGERQRKGEKRVLELDRMLAEEKQQQVVLKPHKEQKKIANEALTPVEIQTKPEKKEIAVGKETDEERKLEKVELELQKEQKNIAKEAFTQVGIPPKPEKKETMMVEEADGKTGLVKGMTTECFKGIEQSVDKGEHPEVEFEDGQVEDQSFVKDNKIQKEKKTTSEDEEPTQGGQIITFTESKESTKDAQLEPEDTPPKIENTLSEKTGGEENRSVEENEQPKQAMRQKTCGMEWLTDYRHKREQEKNGLQSEQTETNNIIIKPEKYLLHSGCRVRPVVGRRQRACETTAEKAQLELVEHKDLEDDDWFGDMAVKNRENKRAEINRRHQQSRQQSILTLQSLTDQPEKKDEDNKGMNLRSRHATRQADADEGWLLEVRQRDTKQTMSQRNEKMDWLCESKTKKQIMDSESVTAATMVEGRRSRRTQASTIENTETPTHKELNDDWLRNSNKDGKWANINRRHQQNREQSRHELQKKQIDLAEQTANSKIMAVAPNVRNPVKNIDAEVNKQDMEPNTREEWWRELRRNNQRKLMGNQRKQETGVHVSKSKEQARDNKQSQITGIHQTTESWFGEWMTTKKCDKNPDMVRTEKVRCPSRGDNNKTGNVEALVTNALMMSEVEDSKVTAEKVRSNGLRSGLWDSLKGELHIQPRGSYKEASQLDFGDTALHSTRRKVVSPLQQTTTPGHQRTSIDRTQNKTTFELDDDDGLESITLEEDTPERKPQMWSTKAIDITAAPKRTTNTPDTNKQSRVLLNNPTDMAKENREVEHAPHGREQEKAGEVHKHDELSAMKQRETREDSVEDVQATYYSKCPSVVPLSRRSLDADSEKNSHKEQWQSTPAVLDNEKVHPVEEDKLLHDTEDQGTLEKSPSLVNLLVSCSDASGEEGDGRSETASLSYEIADDVHYENVNDKSVRRRVLKWMNKKAKNYYSKKIDKTFKREQEEGDELYTPWYRTTTQLRSEREQEKRKALLKAEEMRRRLEGSLLKWDAKRAQKRALRMEEEYSYDREPDDIWFVEDLL